MLKNFIDEAHVVINALESFSKSLERVLLLPKDSIYNVENKAATIAGHQTIKKTISTVNEIAFGNKAKDDLNVTSTPIVQDNSHEKSDAPTNQLSPGQKLQQMKTVISNLSFADVSPTATHTITSR